MKYLYMNNFRGFSNTYIPILDVNFFVGENSTGKTSILKLIKLLSMQSFWFNTDFTVEDIEFSHFGDIVSANAKNKGFFDIGLIKIDNGTEDIDKVSAFLMTFTQKGGMPNLSVFSYKMGQYVTRVRFGKNTIKYKVDAIDNNLTKSIFLEEVFPSWLTDHRKDTKGYSYLKAPQQVVPGEIPLIILPELIRNISEKNKKEKRLLSRGILFNLAFDEEIAWIAPIRTKPKRTYDMYKTEFSSEGDHTPYLIKKILDKESLSKKFKKYIKEVGSSSGLFDDILIKRYGRNATSPFELDVVLNKQKFSICSVGYGVSQSIPVIVELFIRNKNSWFAIQQPEVHLHPKAQAALGDIFFQLFVSENKRFFIETHSDYTIDRFRLNFRKNKDHIPDSQILFFERTDTGNKVYQLKIQPNGDLPQEQPENYREFFIKEELANLGL